MHTFIDNVASHGNLYMSDSDEVAYCETLRERASRLFRCPSSQVAIVASASEILGQLPMLLQPRPTSTILAVSSDFPAITRPWLRLAALKGHAVRFVDDRPACDLTDTLTDAIDESTSVVAVSSVQYATGTVVDISRLRQSTVEVGARLIVDVTQAAGAMRVDAAAWDADAVVTADTNGLVDMEALHWQSCRHSYLSKSPLYRVGWARRTLLDSMQPPCRYLMMRGATRSQQCRMSQWQVSWYQLSSCLPSVKLALRHMQGVWQQCWLVKPASMVGNRFAALSTLLGLHTSFHWLILAKTYKQLWLDFVVTMLCAVHVVDAFGFRSLLTTTKVISTSLSKHLQEQVRDPASV